MGKHPWNKGAATGFIAVSKDIVGKSGSSGEMSATREAAACYRLYAANCLEIAGNIPDQERRIFLLRMAQGWTRLADHMEKWGDGPTAEATTEPRSTSA